MFHGDRFGAVGKPAANPACDVGIAGLRRWAVAPTRDAGAPLLLLGARAACLILDIVCLSKAVAAPVDGTAASGAPVAVFAFPAVAALALAGVLRLGVFRWASAKGITQTASSRVT